MSSTPSAALQIGPVSIPVHAVRNPRSRRYILRLIPAGGVRVTIPKGGSLACALEFVEKNRSWIEKRIAEPKGDWKVGDRIWFRGEQVIIQAESGNENLLDIGGVVIARPKEGQLRRTIEWRWRALAVPELIARTRELASHFGFQVAAVQVRDQRSRWGSCSSKGKISLNWRLIQTPEFVRDYIIIHELMHMREMNHSERFWKHVEGAFPRYREAETWLRRHSRALR